MGLGAAAIAVALLLAACGAADDNPNSATPVGRTSGGAPVEPESSPEAGAGPSDTPGQGAPRASAPAEPEGTESPRGTTDSSGRGSLPSPPPEEAGEGLPEQVPGTTGAPVTGEVAGSVLADIKADLAARTGAADDAMVVVRAEEVIWNDGSLGCPEPGQMYTQALVNGFWVVLEYGGQTYDYRASDSGYFRLCEGLGVPPSNPTG